MEAMKDMFAFYGVPFTELMAKDMWVTDFGLGDFENLGMGGIFLQLFSLVPVSENPRLSLTCLMKMHRLLSFPVP